MSTALLHVLVRPLCLRAKEVSRATQLALTLTNATRKRYLLCRVGGWEALSVRRCSGPTTFKQHTFILGAKEEDPQKDVTAPQPLPESHQPDLFTPAETSENFLLPSQQQRHQSDLLVIKIKECESFTDAFGIYQRHSEVMDTKHCLAVIAKLSELVNNRLEDGTQLQDEESFKTLCSQLFTWCRRMEVDELVMLLKHLSYLRVDPTSKLMQAVLQMMKNQINDLSLRQLIFLEFLLRKIALTPLSDALLIAIPIVMNSALTSSKVKELSFPELSQAFMICCSVKGKGMGMGMGILLQEMYHRGSVHDVSLATKLLRTLTYPSFPRMHWKLLTQEDQLAREVVMKECLETVTWKINSLTYKQVKHTLSKICKSHGLGDRCCYHERLLHAVASYVCSHSLPFQESSYINRELLKMNYLSDELVRHIVRQILAQPEEVLESRVGMLSVISAITATPLPQHDLKAALDVVMTHRFLRMDSEELYKTPLLDLAAELLSVGYYHPRPMGILTSQDTLSLYMLRCGKAPERYYRLLEVDEVLGEVFESPHRVPEIILKHGRKLAASRPPSKSTLKAMLCQILGDPNHIVSGVITEGGIYIDHLIVLDSEGVPFKVENDDVSHMMNPCMTSLHIPSGATKLAILDVGSSSAYRPTGVLKAPHRLRQRILEAADMKVVTLLQSVIYLHHDEEKVLYVKRELTEAGMNLR